ncbi:MAG: hypothetical protein NZ519_11100 [Bacteroidia bacterium]|nr:hypothetical protein [Bacteroidia bacterium]
MSAAKRPQGHAQIPTQKQVNKMSNILSILNFFNSFYLFNFTH